MMIDIAIQNLKLLNEIDFELNNLMAEDNKLSVITKDTFDVIEHTKSLEYPIYFTYHHILNKISDDAAIKYSHNKYLLHLIENSLDNLYDFINKIETDEDENEEQNKKEDYLLTIVNEIEERYEIIITFSFT